MAITGHIHRFGDDINTDYIFPSRRKTESVDVADLARYTFEDIDPDFVNRVRPGDVIVAGRNFGCGSSREGAVHVLKVCGIVAVVAVSFARIFFRNAINNGLLVIECDAQAAQPGEMIEIDPEQHVLRLPAHDATMTIPQMPPVVRRIVDAGGLVAYMREHGSFDEIATGPDDAAAAGATRNASPR